MALCYNFTRVLNILGFEGFVAALASCLLFPNALSQPPCSASNSF